MLESNINNTMAKELVEKVNDLSLEASPQGVENPFSQGSLPEIQRFHNSMATDSLKPVQTDSLTVEKVDYLCPPESTRHCLGDSILEGMQKIKGHYDQNVAAVNQAVHADTLTPQDIIKLQLDIGKLQLQEEILAKTASKTTQNIDTLLKSQ